MQEIDVTALIDAAFMATAKQEKTGRSVSAGVIGNECIALLALSLRGYPGADIDPTLQRIFRDGHRIEDQVIKDLRRTGLSIMETDPSTGKQWEFIAYGGHVKGRADGLIEIGEDRLALLEIKSMNKANFDKVSEIGVRQSHPKYYAQMQLMMGIGDVRSCLFLSYCKNSSRYYHEWVDYDELYFQWLDARIERVLNGETERIGRDETDWRCRGCFKADACWRGALPTNRDMRTCGNTIPTGDGGFECTKGCADACVDWRPVTLTDRR